MYKMYRKKLRRTSQRKSKRRTGIFSRIICKEMNTRHNNIAPEDALFYIIDKINHFVTAVIYKDDKKVIGTLMYKLKDSDDINCRNTQFFPHQLTAIENLPSAEITKDFRQVVDYLEKNRVDPPRFKRQ